MEIMRCKNGHSYDPSITPECPECARLRGGTVPLDGAASYGGTEEIGKTEPVNPGVPFQPQNYGRPMNKTEGVNYQGAAHWADAEDYMKANYASEDYMPTMPKNYQEEKNDKVLLPVTGWLVCIEGPSKGMDYRIHDEYNYIGRGSKMDICIQGDPTVSRENHAIIAYDTQEKLFYFAPSGGGSIVRVNGKAVLGNVELKAYDRLSIGQSVFLFIPLCGENFEW